MVLILLSAACSTKKNTAMSRQWQAFNTRYNVYYNGDEHYRQTLKDMERDYQDEYTQRLMMHPAEARANERLPQPTGSFDRTIEKMQKAIQLHSIKKKPQKRSSSQKDKEFRAREEFNPFLHNAWLMMGRAQYYNGDFLGAAATFFYIARHFKWLPQVVTEATLWQARCYCAMDWNYEAENLLRLVKEKQLVNKNLRYLYNFTMADYLVRSDEPEKAIPYLEKTAAASHGTQRNRIYYLLGQTQQRLGNKQAAYQAYKKAGSGQGIDYRAKFNARISQSEVYTGKNIKGEVGSLRALTRFERNKEYFDQIYYAIGNLYLSAGDTAQAMKNYATAVEKSERKGINQALAQLALGRLQFLQGDYVKAQPNYSAALPQLPADYPGYKEIQRRSDVLDELATYAGNVHLQDSLLDLSKLSEEEQMKVCKRLADEYTEQEKRDLEKQRREEYLAEQEGRGEETRDPNAPQQFTMNSDKSWYFYNTTAKNAGKTEFQRRWGARKLEDDWRRRNKNTFDLGENEEYNYNESTENGGGDGDKGTQSGAERDSVLRSSDPHNAEYYFRNIPRTPEELRTCNDIIQEGLFNMGVILKDKLDDYPASRHQFMRLEERYPDNIYRLDVYYNMYLMAVRENDTAEAERWRAKILSDFPTSPYGQAMRDPNYFENLRTMEKRQEQDYEEAYKAYLDNDNNVVHSLTQTMEEKYPLSPILPKFVFIDALSYLTQKEYDRFKERLTYLLDKWPDTDMTDVAGSILRGIKQGRQLQGGGTNSRGMLWNMRLGTDSLTLNENGEPAQFEYDPAKPQLLVLVFPRDSVNANQVLYDVARHNFSSFVVRDYELEPMSFGNMGLLIVSGFANMRELEHYRSVMARDNNFDLPPQVSPVMISKANFELLLTQGRSFEEYFRFREQEEERQRHLEVVGEPLPDDGNSENPENPNPAPESASGNSENSENSNTEPSAEPETEME